MQIKKYTDRQGVEKTQWNNIGTITEFYKDDGSVSRIIEIPAIGLDANIFEQKLENTQQAPAQKVETKQDKTKSCLKCKRYDFLKKQVDKEEKNKSWFHCNYCNFLFWVSKSKLV